MEQISYIIENKKGKFKPFIGKVVPDDDDSSLYPVANGKNYEDLKDAQKFLKENSGDMEFYLNPVKSNEYTGMTWLSEVLEANP